MSYLSKNKSLGKEITEFDPRFLEKNLAVKFQIMIVKLTNIL